VLRDKRVTGCTRLVVAYRYSSPGHSSQLLSLVWRMFNFLRHSTARSSPSFRCCPGTSREQFCCRQQCSRVLMEVCEDNPLCATT
jgi:hypothetical protein